MNLVFNTSETKIFSKDKNAYPKALNIEHGLFIRLRLLPYDCDTH